MPELIVLRCGVPAIEDGHEGDDRRKNPAAHQHPYRDLLRHVDRIAQGLDDGVVTVHRDEHEMEDGDGAEVDVEGVPHVAHEVAEHPVSGYLHRGVERHREHGDEHVGEGERYDEVVRDDAQLPVTYHRHHHQKIAEHRRHDYRAEDAAQDYRSVSKFILG